MSTSERPAPEPGPEPAAAPSPPPYPGQPYPAQPYPAQPYGGDPYPGSPYPGAPHAGQQPYGGDPYPYPPPHPGQPYPYPAQPYPGQPYPYPGHQYPAQQYPVQPSPVGRPAPPPRDRRTAWLLVGVFAVAEVVFVLASVLVLVAFSIGDPSRPDGAAIGADALVTALVVPTVLAALVAAAGAWLVTRARPVAGAAPPDGSAPRRGVAAALSARWSWRDVGIGLALGVGGLVITLPASYIWANAVGEDQATSAVGEAFGDLRLGPWAAVLVFLAVWLVAPLCEEVLYRGVLWGALERFGWGRWVVFAVTTVVFAVAHLELLRTPLLIVVSVPIGLARLLTGNVLASVVAHQANNFLPAVGLALLVSGGLPA